MFAAFTITNSYPRNLHHPKKAEMQKQIRTHKKPRYNKKNQSKPQNKKRTGTEIYNSAKKPLRTLMHTTHTTNSQNVPVVQKTVQYLYSSTG